MTCWHCSSTNACRCISCGKDIIHGDKIVRAPGPCQWCIGRDFVERHRAVFDAYSTTDRNNYDYYPAHDGNPKRMIWKPTKGLE